MNRRYRSVYYLEDGGRRIVARSSGYLRLSEVGNHTAFSAQTGRSPLQLRNNYKER